MTQRSDDYVSGLATRLRRLIDQRHGSMSALERAMGLGDNYVRGALNGSKRLTVELVVEVLLFMGVDPDDFFAGRTDEPYSKSDVPPGQVLAEVQTSYGVAPDAEATRHLVAELGATGAFAALVRVLLEKGVLTAADLTQAGDAGKKKV